MNLEPEMAAFVAATVVDKSVAEGEITLEQLRTEYRQSVLANRLPHPAGLRIMDERLENGGVEVPLRRYTPTADGALPCVVYFHGGGWVMGDLDTHDDITADMAAATGSVVIAVDYRLAPEHPYPAALDDCIAALSAIAGSPERYGIDPSRIIVCGDSAGGNLAAALCLWCRDRGGPPISGQVLIYPGLTDRLYLPSHFDNAESPVLTASDMEFFFRAYVESGVRAVDCYAAPLLAADASNLPQALIVTLEFDPLRDDGRVYAQSLREAGTPVELYDAEGLVHGCLRARRSSPGSERMFERICDWIRDRGKA